MTRTERQRVAMGMASFAAAMMAKDRRLTRKDVARLRHQTRTAAKDWPELSKAIERFCSVWPDDPVDAGAVLISFLAPDRVHEWQGRKDICG